MLRRSAMQRNSQALLGLLFLVGVAVVLILRAVARCGWPSLPSRRRVIPLPAAPSASAPAPIASMESAVEAALTPDEGTSEGFDILPDGSKAPPLPDTAPQTVTFGVIQFAYDGAQFAQQGLAIEGASQAASEGRASSSPRKISKRRFRRAIGVPLERRDACRAECSNPPSSTCSLPCRRARSTRSPSTRRADTGSCAVSTERSSGGRECGVQAEEAAVAEPRGRFPGRPPRDYPGRSKLAPGLHFSMTSTATTGAEPARRRRTRRSSSPRSRGSAPSKPRARHRARGGAAARESACSRRRSATRPPPPATSSAPSTPSRIHRAARAADRHHRAPAVLQESRQAAGSPGSGRRSRSNERSRALIEQAFFLADHENDAAGRASPRRASRRSSARRPDGLGSMLELFAPRRATASCAKRALARRAALVEKSRMANAACCSTSPSSARVSGDSEGATTALEVAVSVESSHEVPGALPGRTALSRARRAASSRRAPRSPSGPRARSDRRSRAGDGAGVPTRSPHPAHAADAWLRAAEAHRRAGDPSQATLLLDRALEQLPGDPALTHARLTRGRGGGRRRR